MENLRWRSSLKPVEAGVSGRLGSRYIGRREGDPGKAVQAGKRLDPFLDR